MPERTNIQSAVSFFIWKFKTQIMAIKPHKADDFVVFIMIVNQIGKLTLTIKMSNKGIKWPPIGTSIQHWEKKFKDCNILLEHS